VLPRGFVRIRNFGFLANRRRAALLPLCFHLLGAFPQSSDDADSPAAKDVVPLWTCPRCGGPMIPITREIPTPILLRAPPVSSVTADAAAVHA
jgi:hypothetical protein